MTNTRAVATRSVRPAATDWTRPARTASTTVEHNDRPRHENKITGGWVFPPDLSHELRYTSNAPPTPRPGRHRPRPEPDLAAPDRLLHPLRRLRDPPTPPARLDRQRLAGVDHSGHPH